MRANARSNPLDCPPMDRPLRRRGALANTAGLLTRSRAEVLATLPLHVSAGIRRVLNGAGYVVDELRHPSWRRVEVRAPLFIVAPARSGTTLLYHLLADDPQFAAPALGHTLIRSISVSRMLTRLASKPGSAFDKARIGINEDMAKLDATHTLRIERLEEDEGFFNDHFAAHNMHLFFPTLVDSMGLVPLDERPAQVQRAVMRRYANYIRRFLYLVGRERTYLGKNVAAAGRIASLDARFPDARFINIVRDPLVQLPSALALIRSVAESSHGRVRPPDHPYWKAVAASVIDNHRRLLAWEKKLPAERWLTLRYDALIADPAQALRKVYAHFDLPLDAEAEARLGGIQARAQGFRKQRSYSLGDYGIEAEEVREQLSELYQVHALADPGETA